MIKHLKIFTVVAVLAFLGLAFFASSDVAQASDKPKMATEMPVGITAPAEAKTRLGTLRTKNGFPDKATIEKVYDNLDFQRDSRDSQLFTEGDPKKCRKA
jgi:hypothetical protein